MDLSPKMTPIAESSQVPNPQTRINTGFQAWGQFPLWETRRGCRPLFKDERTKKRAFILLSFSLLIVRFHHLHYPFSSKRIIKGMRRKVR